MKGTLIIFIFLLGLSSQAQYLEDKSGNDFFSITVEDGLSQNTINCILKDKTGYMWFGSNSGLNRYNGYEIEVMGLASNSQMSLANATVLDLYEDSLGVIWIATHSGLFSYDQRLEKLIFINATQQNSVPFHIYCIQPEGNSQFWLGTSDGLLLFDKREGIIEEYRHKPYQSYTISNSNVISLASKGDLLWVGTSEGLNVFDKRTRSFQQFQLGNTSRNYDKKRIIRALVIADNNDIWIGTEYNGLFVYTPSTNEFKQFTNENSGLPHNDIRDLFESPMGSILIATNGGGLCRMLKSDFSTTVIQNTSWNQMSLSNNSVYSIYEDHEANLWIGTYAGGVNFNNSRNNGFAYIRQQHFPPSELCGSRIRSLYVDDKDQLWLGSWGGLSVYNPQTKKIKSYYSDNKPGALSFNTTITSIFQDSRGWYWIGTYAGGINLLKPGRKGFIHFEQDPSSNNSLSSNNIYCFAEDINSDIWIGTSSGLNKYIVEEGRFHSYLDENIRDIKFTKEGNLFLGIEGGIAFFNPNSTFFRTYEEPMFDLLAVTQLFIEDSETIWFATQGIGMGRLNIKTNSYELFNETDGLPSGYVSSLIPINDSIIWLTSYRGISKFNKNRGEFLNYGLSDKLPGLEYYPRSSALLPDGNIAVGGSRGLVFFNPDSLVAESQPSKVILTKLRIKNTIVEVGSEDSPLSQSISNTKEITLKNSQKDISFDFLTFNYQYPGENSYSYKLVNYMDDWVDIGNIRSISFTNLDPGEYIFKVRPTLKGRHLIESSETSIAIIVEPPFWYTWWFLTLVFLFLGLLVFIYSRYRTISLTQRRQLSFERMEYEKQKQFHQMRMRFFANISHELRTPLTLIRGPIETLLAHKQEGENERLLGLISRSTQRLLRLVDQILDFRKMESDALKLRVSELDINEGIFTIYDAFQELAKQKKIEYNYGSNLNKEKAWVDIDKLEKILYNIISNAFKFTPAKGKITVTLKRDDEQKKYKIIVEDSGIGVNEEKLNQIFERYYIDENKIKAGGTGIGLAVVKKLVELHHGAIRVESKKDIGSRFEIEIPLHVSAYDEEEIVHNIEAEISNSKKIPAEGIESSLSAKITKEKDALILIVEDEVDLRNYLSDILSSSFKEGSNDQM